MKQIHEIQRQILNKMQYGELFKFSELRPDDEIENNQFNFHLKQLIRFGYIEKIGEKYKLTDTGKKYTANFDNHEKKISTGAMNVVWMVCSRGEKGNREVLIYTRRKHPFYGCQGFPAGKLHIGESVVEGAIRELKEEANLEGVPIVKAVLHYRTFSDSTKELVQDKFLYMCHFNKPYGDLVSSCEGDYEWVLESEVIDYIKKPFFSLEDHKFVLGLLDVGGNGLGCGLNEGVIFRELSEFSGVF